MSTILPFGAVCHARLCVRRTTLEKIVLCVFLYFSQICATTVYAQIRINEIMFAPQSPEQEWIELYNADSLTHDLNAMYLHDGTGRALIPGFVMNANSYAILCRDTVLLKSMHKLETSVKLIKMSIPSLNNNGESLYLQSKDSLVYDSLHYSDSLARSGNSLERIDATKPVRSLNDLQPCRYSEGSSCGEANSVSLLSNDVAIDSLGINGKAERLEILLRNCSNNELRQLDLTLECDERILSKSGIEGIDANSTLLWTLPLEDLRKQLGTATNVHFFARIEASNDPRPRNDTLSMRLSLGPVSGSLLINEIHYEPLEASAEFVEVYNSSADTVELLGMMLVNSSDERMIVMHPTTLPPAKICVFTKDTLFATHYPHAPSSSVLALCAGTFSMRSSGDRVILQNAHSSLQDSLSYDPAWHSKAVAQTKGRSLEKVSEKLQSSKAWSWTSCTDSVGTSPGRVNSVARAIDDIVEMQATPNPFAPLSVRGDKQTTLFHLRVPFAQCVVSLRIFDLNGRCIVVLANGEYSGPECFVQWDGRGPNGQFLPSAAYIAHMEVQDLLSSRRMLQSIEVVVAP